MSDYNPSFPWRDYIQMDIKDPVFARSVEQTLNQMAATPEFQDWVKTGHTNLAKAVAAFSDFKSLKFRPRDDGKILLTDTPPPGLEKAGSFNQSIFGLVYLDKNQIGKYGWKKPDGGWQAMTLPALMIHEFFHQAAPQTTLEAQVKINQAGTQSLIADIVQVDEVDSSKATLLKEQILKAGSVLLRQREFPELEGMTNEQKLVFIQVPANQKKLFEFSQKVASEPSFLNSVKTQIAEKLGLPLSSFSFRKADLEALTRDQVDPKT
ncbi:MAG: hypothetical protein K2X09_08350, partial [Rickettsiales bacterium]|nr:hypothetical protein [Rickettsiales bacterium]